MSNVGIISYGGYIPQYRMSRKTISDAMGWLNPRTLRGEKAVANCDEDSLSMAVAAAIDCLKGVDPTRIDGMYFVTTTSPYREREGAAIIATALDLRSTIRTADFTNSLKGGSAALVSACDSVKAGGVRSILVCASDCRLGRPGSSQEMVFGDGAAAFLLGKEGVIAILEDSYSVSYDFPDYRRSAFDKFVRAVEERFIMKNGYTRFIHEAIGGLLAKCGMDSKDIAKVAYPCLNQRDHAAIGKKLGFRPEQIQEPLLATVGESGTASPFLLLVAMLEEAKPGDTVVIANYGNGAEALVLTVTEEIERMGRKRGVQKHLTHRRELASYEKYLAFRGILPVESRYGEETAPTQLPLTWRERKAILALYGSQCKRCGTAVYPAQKVCINPECGAINEMKDYRFADKGGTVFGFTQDYTAPVLDPPLIYGMVDFEGGGRFLLEFTDCEPDSIRIGVGVEMTFRRKYVDQARGIHQYFWKAMPAKE